MTKIKWLLTASLSILSIPVFAAVSELPLIKALKGIEFSAAGGPTISKVNDTSLVVSSNDIDNVIVTQVTRSALWKVGIGYHFFAERLAARRYFNDLLVQLNIYRNAETARGDVWRYQSPAFNDYAFTAPITTTSAMIDVKPGLFTAHHVTFYPILGAGVAWSTVSYREAITSEGVDADSYHALGNSTNKNVTYDLGAGARLYVTEHLSASLEYLYNRVVDISPAGESTTAAQLSSPPEFTVDNQSLLFGLNWTV